MSVAAGRRAPVLPAPQGDPVAADLPRRAPAAAFASLVILGVQGAAMQRPRAIVTVDEQLVWLIARPESPAGASCPASAMSLELLGARFDAMGRAAADAVTAGVTGAVTAALMEWLSELPELPFIGEPFGGVEGTD